MDEQMNHEETSGDANQSTAMTPAANHSPAIPQANPFEEAGRESQRTIIGDILKFSKGDWLAGKDSLELPMGTRMIANMDQLLRGWVRWEDNKPAEQIMGLVAEGYVPPKRNTLGFGYTPETKKEEDIDKTDWILDESTGQLRDPWQKTWYMLLRELDKEGKPLEGEGLYTFSAASKGSTDAIAELCSVYGKWMRVHPDDYPVVTLGYSSYKHPNPQFGIIKTPEFVTGFINSEQARHGKKIKLFDPGKPEFWMPKSAFGEIDGTAGPSDGEDVPF